METYLTSNELADYLKLTEQTIRRWVQNGEIPFCKIKSVIRFRVTEIEKWIDGEGKTLTAKEKRSKENGLLGTFCRLMNWR
jgi:PTS system nitrogen regulatory IIA component